MFRRDLPYKNCLWRNQSALLSNQTLYDYWYKTLTDLNDVSLILVNFMLTGHTEANYPLQFEPLMKTCGMWKAMGPGRRYTTEEVLALDELHSIEIVKQRFPVKVDDAPST